MRGGLVGGMSGTMDEGFLPSKKFGTLMLIKELGTGIERKQ